MLLTAAYGVKHVREGRRHNVFSEFLAEVEM
jgi:hypothetical protein